MLDVNQGFIIASKNDVVSHTVTQTDIAGLHGSLFSCSQLFSGGSHFLNFVSLQMMATLN